MTATLGQQLVTKKVQKPVALKSGIMCRGPQKYLKNCVVSRIVEFIRIGPCASLSKALKLVYTSRYVINGPQ